MPADDPLLPRPADRTASEASRPEVAGGDAGRAAEGGERASLEPGGEWRGEPRPTDMSGGAPGGDASGSAGGGERASLEPAGEWRGEPRPTGSGDGVAGEPPGLRGDARPLPGAEPSVGSAARDFGAALRRSGAARARAAGAGIAGGAAALRGLAGRRTESAEPADAPASAPSQAAGPAAPEPARFVRRRRPRAPGTRAIRWGWRLFLASILFLLVGAGGTLAAIWFGMRDLPLAQALPALEEPSVSISLPTGEVLTTQGAYRASYVALDEMPPVLIQAVIATEDRRFYDHGGVDLRGISRALVRNVAAGGVVEGGSTITQQLVKILYLDPERTISRKLQEAVLAVMLERQLGKDRILELYLNSVYLGAGAYGMPAAAETYFGKDIGELTLPEAAVLAASIQLPSRVNPIADLQEAQNRGALVLGLMADQGLITPEEEEAALAEMALLAPEPPPTRAGSYFADWVLNEVSDLEGASSARLQAVATLDPALQARVEDIVRRIMAQEGPEARATQAAVVVMTTDGRVRAMVGGLNYSESQFNRATDALRQPGSTFKLFVYLAALVLGATPDTRISDAPIEIDGWAPQNFDERSHGTVTLAQAFVQSYNQATVRLAQEVGIDNVIEVAQRLGIESELPARPSLALGTVEVTLLDMTEAYAAMALGRAPVHATGIETIQFGEGDPLSVSRTQEAGQTRMTRTRDPMVAMLRQVVAEGTGRAAQIEGRSPAGKTGTTQESRDAWFIGFAGGMVAGVWVGNDDNSPMREVTGGGLPARIWREVMVATLGDGAEGSDSGASAAALAQAPPVQCNVRACSAAYRSFRAEDCTFQPYEGPREICTR